MPHGFDDPLHLVASTASLQQASGTVNTGETLTWIRVWVIQDQQAAAASGRGDGPFTGTWAVSTTMVTANNFQSGKKAIGIAMALVVEAGGGQRVEWWKDNIKLV
jgi:hypothetical protein